LRAFLKRRQALKFTKLISDEKTQPTAAALLAATVGLRISTIITT
jgi:hypothetical protein